MQLLTAVLLQSADLFGGFFCFCQLYFVASTKVRTIKVHSMENCSIFADHVCIVIYRSTFHVINTILSDPGPITVKLILHTYVAQCLILTSCIKVCPGESIITSSISIFMLCINKSGIVQGLKGSHKVFPGQCTA